MKRKFENLILSLSKFAEDWWLPYKDSMDLLLDAIDRGIIDKRCLNDDFIKATSTVDFNWIDLARESELLINPEIYSHIEAKNYVNFLLHDYLFPESVLDKEKINELNSAVEDILKKNDSNDGWMYSYDLFDKLKRLEGFVDLEYYNLWKLPFIRRKIEQKYIENKDREIGYLRYIETLDV